MAALKRTQLDFIVHTLVAAWPSADLQIRGQIEQSVGYIEEQGGQVLGYWDAPWNRQRDRCIGSGWIQVDDDTMKRCPDCV